MEQLYDQEFMAPLPASVNSKDHFTGIMHQVPGGDPALKRHISRGKSVITHYHSPGKPIITTPHVANAIVTCYNFRGPTR